ncbi:uncharacterized protein LOC110700884 [Chenopodium quinoa]|uniref:uncharacterized protein LOC110700884 n=1 Tax=Chenopodium quinoa TaxID=63459 RepID=UPI000B7889B8|nr:uncharacterized protein LOC110700884 [Chenopodium quinoa]
MGALMWAAWFCRNKVIFNNERVNVVLVAAGYAKLVEDYGEYVKKVGCVPVVGRSNGLVSNAAGWFCPTSGVVKVNVDAYVCAGSMVGLGAVVRDDRGKLLVAGVKCIPFTTPAIAEGLAARYGLSIAKRFGFNIVHVESDATSVIRGVQGKRRGMTPTHLIYEDIRHDKAFFDVCVFSHVRRACNTVAYHIARWDTGTCDELVCTEPFPQSTITLAELDLI